MIAGALAAVAVALAAAPGGQPGVMLHCDGFNRALGGTIGHDVVIRADRASIDGRRFTKREITTAYLLRGPVTAGKGDRGATEEFEINRVDGSYLVFDARHIDPRTRRMDETGMEEGALEWSRPEDAGCTIATQKF